MKLAQRRLRVCALFSVVGFATEHGLAIHLAQRDPIAASISGSLGSVLATAIPLACLRVFVLFLLPCWWAFVLASLGLAWLRARARGSA